MEPLTRTQRVIEWRGCTRFQLSANQPPGVTRFFNYPLHYAPRKTEETPKCHLWVYVFRKTYHFTKMSISFPQCVSIRVLSSVWGRVDANKPKLNDVHHGTHGTWTQRPAGRQQNKHAADVEGASGGTLSGDKLGKMFTLRIHYANEDVFSALPSRNHHAVHGHHTGDNVVVALQAPQAEPRPLPGWLELREFVFCARRQIHTQKRRERQREKERESERRSVQCAKPACRAPWRPVDLPTSTFIN